MQAQQKITVVKTDTNHAIVRNEVSERDFWIEQRHALLMQLASIERRLGMVHRRCRYCNNRVEEQAR